MAEAKRGQGLAGRLLDSLVEAVRPHFIEVTVSPGNAASLAAFHALARRHSATITSERCLAEADFPAAAGTHEPELLIRIAFPI